MKNLIDMETAAGLYDAKTYIDYSQNCIDMVEKFKDKVEYWRTKVTKW
jgi:hypothetical protein